MRPSDDQLPLHEAAQGFYKFLQFCQALCSILDRAEGSPLLRAGMWFHYSYWFDIIGERVARYMKNALAQFGKWSFSGSELVELQTFIDSASATIDTLVNKSIGKPLLEAERKCGHGGFTR